MIQDYNTKYESVKKDFKSFKEDFDDVQQKSEKRLNELNIDVKRAEAISRESVSRSNAVQDKQNSNSRKPPAVDQKTAMEVRTLRDKNVELFK